MTINPADYGFDQIRYLKPTYAPRPLVNARNARLKDDPREILPGVKTVILLVKKWVPYKRTPDEATVSAYYIASNAAHAECERLARDIRASGYEAVADAQIAVKPLLRLYGGVPGLNSLISLNGYGTRFHAQIILTDMPAELETPQTSAGAIHENCASCMACVKACPARAISKDGRVDISRCLRALDDGQPVREDLRPAYGNSLLGCDICQNVCLRNAHTEFCDMPEPLRASLDLRALLSGDMGALESYIGRNYARKTRIRMKAALVAACNKREDCLDLLEALAREGLPGEREHAAWACDYIKGRKL